jgi:alpha-N-arabinofuranosidase
MLNLRHGAILAVAIGATAVGCAFLGPGASDGQISPPSTPIVSKRILTCEVQADQPVGPVPPGVFGTNVEWFNNGNGLVNDRGQFDGQLVRLAGEQGITLVRFPGGTLSDFYHWKNGIGPQDRRPTSPHGSDSGRSVNRFGTPELMKFCGQIGANPLLTVNVGTGTPEEAAAWVAYCNQPGHAERAADGFPEPFGVKLWEVGNELYLSGNDVERSITMPPEQYAARFLAFAKAMRAVDPRISLMAIGTAPSTRIPISKYENWSETVLRMAAAEIDYVAVHNAYFPMLAPMQVYKTQQVYEALWASPESVSRSLTQLAQTIAAHEKGRDIGIAITEWGVFYSFLAPTWVDQVKTLGSAVYVGRIVQVFLSHPKVRVANYFKFTDRTFMGWVSYAGETKVPYHVIELFRKHFGKDLVRVRMDSPTYQTPALALVPAESNVPLLTAAASVDKENGRLYVNIVSRSWNTIHNVRLSLKGFKPSSNMAKVWAIEGPSVLSNNGRDLPPEWPWPYVELEPSKQPIRISERAADIASPIGVQPHSVLTIEIAGRMRDG